MTPKRIFLTGASGCIGHYLAETLIQNTPHELFLLVRNPAKLKIDSQSRQGVHILQGNLHDIEVFQDLLKTIDVAILAATAWGGTQEVFTINVAKTLQLVHLLDPDKCEQVIYFSTASILNYNHNLLPQARVLGTDYIRSKYECYTQLQKLNNLAIAVLFPTLVIGGDANKPASHLSAGLPDVVKWVNLLRWFKADGSFHFIHAQDIAQIVHYLIDHPPQSRSLGQFVLGNPRVSVNELIEAFCTYLGKPIYFRFPLPLWLANFLIAVFRIQMTAWDRFCLQYRHFSHRHPVAPATFGLLPYCSTLFDVFKLSGIPPQQR